MNRTALCLAVLSSAVAATGQDLLSTLSPASLHSTDGKAELVQIDGRPAVRLTGVSKARAGSKSCYLEVDLKLAEPIDLTGKSITFSARSSRPAGATGFYFRAYAAAARPVWSFCRWGKDLLPQNGKKYTLTAGVANGLAWEPDMVSGEAATGVTSLKFIVGAETKDVPLELVINDLAAIPVVAAAGPAPLAFNDRLLAELGGVQKITRSFGGGARFEVADDGGGTIRFRRDNAENKYAGLVFHLKSPVDLTGKSLALNVRGDNPPGGLYIRLYNAGSAKPCWSVASWSGIAAAGWKDIFVQQGGGSGGFTWESAVVDAAAQANNIDRIEIIIGTQKENDHVDLQFKNLRGDREKDAVAALKKPVALPRTTVLIAGRQTQTEILHPDTAPGRAAAATVAAAIRQTTGTAVRCRPGTKADRMPAGHAVMLGNIYNNPAMLTLYARGLALADEMFPGEKGFIVDSVVEPFRRGRDIIVLGASDDAGLATAAAEFARIVAANGKAGRLELPHSFKASYAAPFAVPPPAAATAEHLAKGLEEARRRLKTGQHTSLGGYLAEIGERYRLWRNPDDARLFAAVAKTYAESAQADPRKFGGAWGFDSDFRSYAAIGMWDIVEHDPALTDDDRLQVTNTLCRWLVEAIAAEAAGGKSGRGVVSNHLTFASLGTLMGSVYIGKYYGDSLEEPKQWEAIVRHNFARQYDSAKAHDDCNGYQWLTWHHLLLYSVAMPDETFFANGFAAQVINSMLLTMDNLGYQAPYGDTGSWKCWTSEVICLDIYYAATRDPLAAYLLSVKRQVHPGHKPGSFQGKIEKYAIPKQFNGVRVLPLDRKYFDDFKPARPAFEQTFDKISFREKLDPQAFYLLIDGVNNGGHKHADANSVLRHTQFNRIWLADNDYFKSQQKFHNALMLTADGASFLLPDFIELLDAGENELFGWSSTRANELGPDLSWTRHLVYLKPEQAYVAIDEVSARQAREVILKQRWHSVGELEKTGDGALLTQQGPSMRLQGQPDSRYAYWDDYELGANWSGYLHAKPVVRVIDQIRRTAIPADGKARIAAVWHGVGNGTAPIWKLEETAAGFRIDTGKKAYLIDFDADGKLKMTEGGSAGEIEKATVGAAASRTADVSPLPTVWQDIRRDEKRFFNFVSAEGAKIFPFTWKCSDPAPRNALVPAAVNKITALTDGNWDQADNSVMFAKDQPVAMAFEFEKPIEISRVLLRLWWSNASSSGDKFKLAVARVYLDGDLADTIEASDGNYPNFGSPVDFALNFQPRQSKTIRIELTPQPDTSLYLAEVELNGNAPLTAKLPDRFVEFTCVKFIPSPDGDRVAAGTGDGALLFYTPNGKLSAEYQLKNRINALEVADLNGDGQPEILAAMQDGRLVVLDLHGTILWQKEFEFYRVFPAVTVVRVADLNGDGRPEILVGCDNWRTYALTADGKELWNYEVVHPTRAVTVADLDGDGKKEVLCGTKYYSMSVLDARGLLKWRAGFGPGCRSIVTPKLADGRIGVTAGSDNGNLYFFDGNGAKLAEFITGDEVRTLAVTPNPDGSDDIFAGSFNSLVYRFSSGGKLQWFRPLDGSVTAVTALPDGSVLAGSSEGEIVKFAAGGETLGRLKLNGEIAAIEVDAAGHRAIAVSRHGEIVEFSF